MGPLLMVSGQLKYETHPGIIIVNIGWCETLHDAASAPFALVLHQGQLVLPKLGCDALCRQFCRSLARVAASRTFPCRLEQPANNAEQHECQ
jgi:hypothetical protein